MSNGGYSRISLFSAFLLCHRARGSRSRARFFDFLLYTHLEGVANFFDVVLVVHSQKIIYVHEFQLRFCRLGRLLLLQKWS